MESLPPIDVIVNAFMLQAISGFLLIKAFIFRRRGEFGRGLALSNVAIAVAFEGSFAALCGLDFFRSTLWSWGIRFVVMVAVIYAAHQMSRLYGGWKPFLIEVGYTIRDYWRDWQAMSITMRALITVLVIEFLLFIVLAEVMGLPPEITPRSMTVMPTPTAQQNEETQ